MANWGKLNTRGNVEDRRSFGSTAVGGGIGLAGLALILIINLISGGDPADVLSELQNIQVAPQENLDTTAFEGADDYEVFAGAVVGSSDLMWQKIFAQMNQTYTPPKLVLFRGSTESACGGAYSADGPHYCPLDDTIYLDETFFEELKSRFGATGGDVAEAYVIAHEAGHHAQNELGLASPETNEMSVKTELQADCFAGLWAYSIKNLGVLEPGEIGEAINAAQAVGDDRIQKSTTGHVNPEQWTHGSSAERVSWFTKGFKTGELSACDTFN